MTGKWITAKEALDLVSQAVSDTPANIVIAKRAHAGLIVARAKRFVVGEQVRDNYEIPKKFWWAGGHAALEQSWGSGDFSTWIDEKYHLQAFGVTFRRNEIEETAGVSGDNDQWVSTKAALQMIESMGGGSQFNVGYQVLDYLRIGHIDAKANAMKLTVKDRYQTDDQSVGDELAIPEWFWKKCTEQDHCALDWRSGTFSGTGYVDGKTYQAKFLGVKLRASDLSLFARDEDSKTLSVPANDRATQKPPVSESDLKKWWNSKSSIRDSLSQDELVALARLKYPDHHISRDRVRDLTGSRKRGPKGLSGNHTAK